MLPQTIESKSLFIKNTRSRQENGVAFAAFYLTCYSITAKGNKVVSFLIILRIGPLPSEIV